MRGRGYKAAVAADAAYVRCTTEAPSGAHVRWTIVELARVARRVRRKILLGHVWMWRWIQKLITEGAVEKQQSRDVMTAAEENAEHICEA